MTSVCETMFNPVGSEGEVEIETVNGPVKVNASLDEEKVLSFLSNTSSTNAKRTVDIAKYLYGEKATRKSINPLLYKLQKNGKINKICDLNLANPRWFIC